MHLHRSLHFEADTLTRTAESAQLFWVSGDGGRGGDTPVASVFYLHLLRIAPFLQRADTSVTSRQWHRDCKQTPGLIADPDGEGQLDALPVKINTAVYRFIRHLAAHELRPSSAAPVGLMKLCYVIELQTSCFTFSSCHLYSFHPRVDRQTDRQTDMLYALAHRECFHNSQQDTVVLRQQQNVKNAPCMQAQAVINSS